MVNLWSSPQTFLCICKRSLVPLYGHNTVYTHFKFISVLWASCEIVLPEWIPPFAPQPPSPRGGAAQVKCCTPEPGGWQVPQRADPRGVVWRGSAPPIPEQLECPLAGWIREANPLGLPAWISHDEPWELGSDYKSTGEGPPTSSGSFCCSDSRLTRKLHLDEKTEQLEV